MSFTQVLPLLLTTALVVHVPPSVRVAAQPAPVRQLGFYVGTWNSSGSMRNAPTDRFVPVRSHETCSWGIGGNAVECREKVTSSAGNSDGLYVLGYDSSAKQYTVYGVDDTGATYNGVGTVAPAGSWSWTLQVKMGGEKSNWRYTFTPAGARASARLRATTSYWSRLDQRRRAGRRAGPLFSRRDPICPPA
jgi:hypothetical protein